MAHLWVPIVFAVAGVVLFVAIWAEHLRLSKAVFRPPVPPRRHEHYPSITVIHRRADRYPAPRDFSPERFLEPDPPDTYTWVPFGGGVLDPRLEVSARDVNRTGDVAFVPLVLLAHVDDHRLAALDQLARVGNVELRDLGPDLLEQLAVGRH